MSKSTSLLPVCLGRLIQTALLFWSSGCFAAPAADPVAAASPAGSLIQITLSLLLVTGVLIGFSLLFKKFGMNRLIGGANGPFPIKVIGSVSIGTNQRLMVIEVGEQWIVLGVTAQQINTIATMPRQEAPAGSGNGSPNFAGWMQTALEKYHSKNNDKKP